ncbi:MAG: glycosyltransferase family 87 protein [Patescibacteria group bacterium]
MHKFILLFFIILFFLLTGLIVLTTIPQIDRIDFRAFYTGGLLIRHGVQEDFYNLQTQYDWQHMLFPSLEKSKLYPFFNPPFVALGYSLLTFFPLVAAYTLLSIINALIFLLCCFFLFKKIDKNRQSFFAIFILLFLPVYIVFAQGQSSFMLLLGLILSWFYFKKNKPFLAGVSLAFLIIKPQLLLLPVLLLLWKRQWRALLGIVSVGVLLFILSWVLIGWTGLVQYSQLLLASSSMGEQYGIHPMVQPTIRGFMQLVFLTPFLQDIWIPLSIGIIGVIILSFWGWRGKWQPTGDRFDRQWGILVIAMILGSLHTNYQDLVLLLFPFVVWLNSIKSQTRLFIAGGIINFLFLLFFIHTSLLAPFFLAIMILLIPL